MIDDDSSILRDCILNLDGNSPFEIWRFLFAEEMINQIVCQTNLYGNRDPNFYVTIEEIRKILGILLLSWYHSLPEEHHYWSRQQDLGVPIVANTMSKNRYHQIKKCLHFADNQNLTEGDKVSKIAPLYEMLNRNLIQFGIFNKLLSVNESMLPYFGRHSAKMFIRGKPIRFGFKIWCLCDSDGYSYNMKIYQGKKKKLQDQPLESRVINNTVDVITENSSALLHELYFDKFFTSYSLMSDLAKIDVRATGTTRENRTAGANQKMTTQNNFKNRSVNVLNIAVMVLFILLSGVIIPL